MASAFADIVELAEGCRVPRLRARVRARLPVHAAVAAGDLDADRFASYRKLAGEFA